MIPEATAIACDLAKTFEGLRLRPYLCPAGIPTIGYGATYYIDKRPVALTDPAISKDAAERLLTVTMGNIYVAGAYSLCPTADTPARLAALGDFAFNLGLSRLKSSTLRKRVLDGDWTGAHTEILKWTRGGGKILPGLVRRRIAEAALLTG